MRAKSLTRSLPEKPFTSVVFQTVLDDLSRKLAQSYKNKYLGHLILKPNKASIAVWKKLIPYSPSNIGNWSTSENKPAHLTTYIEKDLIVKLLHLYNASTSSIEGYMTSGASEGNIFAAWLGRKYLQDKGIEKICMITNSLTHYSIAKAADITGVTNVISFLDPRTWTYDLSSLIATIKILEKKGFRGFIIPLTLGYTVGGTEDPIKKITHALRVLTEKNTKIAVFIWIDAAISGLFKPLLDKEYAPFSNNYIHVFVTDFHKMLGVPFPAGVVFYRKELLKLIERPIPYLSFPDSTLLGSRTGISAVAAWATLHRYGLSSLRTSIKNAIILKNEFITTTNKQQKVSRIITSPYSTHGVFIVHKPLPKNYCMKWGLHEVRYTIRFKEKSKTLLTYPFYIIPTLDN
ncbi:MAG: pyridoxal-dependent decarboxylase [Candidatus Roizmanbacteria bacterium]|nr:pyridoxal-dependent decarboxylase [Candidatus Roizmanbacteria bacterium]